LIRGTSVPGTFSASDIKATWNLAVLTVVSGHVGERAMDLREELAEEADQEVLVKLEHVGIAAALLVAVTFNVTACFRTRRLRTRRSNA
jgi:hypothetical protein